MKALNRRDFAKLAGAAMVSGALTIQPTRALTPADSDLSLVDPELRATARNFQDLTRNIRLPTDATLGEFRRIAQSVAQPPTAAVPYAKRVIEGPRGAPDLILYVINGKPGAQRPGILHTHGGGFIAGSAASAIRGLQEVAARLECAIVTVEYRLAPETRFSGSVEDNYAGLRWLYSNAEQIGVDRKRIAVMGESAGGGHAALLALTARDRAEVPLVMQLLSYPMLDDRTGTTRTVPAHIGQLMWTREMNRYGWRCFLGVEPGQSSVPVGAVPARVANLEGLPPTFIGVGALDLFVQENIEYAQRLVESGVPTQLLLVPGAFHGFDSKAPATSVAQQFTAARMNALQRAFLQPSS